MIGKGSWESHACYLACTLTCMFNGFVYAFPILTPKFLKAGFDSSGVVMVGVMLLLGYGIISYPFARFYMGNFMNLSPFTLDRLVSVVSTLVVSLSLCFLMGLVRYAEYHNESLSLPLTCLGYFWFSLGLGVSFYQSTTIASYLFAKDKALRRKAISIMSIGLGVGSCLFTALFYYTLPYFTLADDYVVVFAISILNSTFRIRYMVRDRFDEIPTLQIPQQFVVSGSSVLPSISPPRRSSADAPAEVGASIEESTPGRWPQLSSSELVRDQESETSSNVSLDLDPSNTNLRAFTPPPVHMTSRRPTHRDYLTSPLVWLTSVSVFFAYGTGGVFLYSLGDLAKELVEADQVDQTTFYLVLTFLAFIITARIAVIVIYAHYNWPHINTLWNMMLFGGLIFYVCYPSLAGAYGASALVGFGFGGIVSCTAIISTANFPGGVADGSINLAFAFTLVSMAPFLLALVQTSVYKKLPLTDWRISDVTRSSTFIYLFGVTLLGIASSVALGIHLKKAFKLEQETMRVLRNTTSSLILSPPDEEFSADELERAEAELSARRNQAQRALSVDSGPSELELLFM